MRSIEQTIARLESELKETQKERDTARNERNTVQKELDMARKKIAAEDRLWSTPENHDRSTGDPMRMHIIESLDDIIKTEKSLFGKTGFNSIKFNHDI